MSMGKAAIVRAGLAGVAVALGVALALAVAGGPAAAARQTTLPCGLLTKCPTTTTTSPPPPPTTTTPPAPPPGGPTRGGTLRVLSSEFFEHLDPGAAYFALDYPVVWATERPLYSYTPGSSTRLTPDLASSPPAFSDHDRIVTVHIRPDIRFSPPVDRAVTSHDVAYAIERGANPNVGNGYFGAYFGDIIGAARARGGPIRGITTPDPTTIVFHLTQPTAQFLYGALSLPLTAPVPREYASRFDRTDPSSYEQHLVATGPYMIGSRRGRSLTLVRNPNWNPATDYRPAYLDRIEISEGGDSLAIGNSVLAGSHMVQLDTPAPTIVRRAYRSGQVHITRGAGDHYMTLDNAHGPFRNVNLRRAVWAALNRRAILRLRGGPLLGEVATHFITPGTPGFAQAGGYRGPRFAFNAHPAGDLAVARRYMRRAGYRRGRYTGPPVTFVATTAGDDPQIARIVLDALHRLGFRTRVRLVDEATVYSAWCGVPRRRIDVCTSAGWIRDFADAGTILEVPFNGRSIVPIDNSNWGLVNDPAINRAMARAERVNGSAAHARAWARVDRMLVREAVAVPFEFDNQPNIESRDVDGVGDAWNIGSWDFSFTSLR